MKAFFFLAYKTGTERYHLYKSLRKDNNYFILFPLLSKWHEKPRYPLDYQVVLPAGAEGLGVDTPELSL